jgi:hypothetical protein
MPHISKTGSKKCSKGCSCKEECKCPPNPCSPNNRYHDLFCPEACGSTCGDRRCKCYKIENTITTVPTVVTAVGQAITFNVAIKNVGNLDLCGDILVCFEINGEKFKEQAYKRDETWLPVGSTIVLSNTYLTTARDFQLQVMAIRAQAFVFAEKCGHISNWVRGLKMFPIVTIGGADVVGTLTQTQDAPGAGGVTVTATLATLAGSSVVAAAGATLILPYPEGIVSVTTASPGVVTDDIARTVTITVPVLPIGSTQVFQFNYTGTVGQAYTWSGSVTGSTFNPNMGNNTVVSTIVLL